MHFTSETIADGVSERLFTLGDVPGVLWSPAGATAPRHSRPLVLLAHGGGQHKKAPAMQGRARRLATARGFAAAAIDAPGSGDRPRTEEDERFIAELREKMAAGRTRGLANRPVQRRPGRARRPRVAGHAGRAAGPTRPGRPGGRLGPVDGQRYRRAARRGGTEDHRGRVRPGGARDPGRSGGPRHHSRRIPAAVGRRADTAGVGPRPVRRVRLAREEPARQPRPARGRADVRGGELTAVLRPAPLPRRLPRRAG